MTYEFQSTLFRNLREMCAAIAGEYLSAGGNNSESDQRKFLAESTDAEMADETIEGWGLTGEWATSRDFTREDLIEAFADLRKEMAQDFSVFVALCKERGLSQKALAEVLGINPTRIISYQERLPPSQAKIIALACAAIAADLPPWLDQATGCLEK